MTRYIVALAILGTGALASAQYDASDDISQSAIGFSLRLGGFFPADSKLRDIQTTFVDFGIEYEFEKSLLKNGTTYIAGDWTAVNFLGAKHVANLTINQRFYTKDQRFAVGGTPYFYAGAGAAFTHVAGSDGTTWVIRAGLGSEFQGDYFAEVGGVFSPKVNGVNASGIVASVGYRFKG